MKKKGIIFDWGIYIVYLFILSIVIVSCYMILSKSNDAFQETWTSTTAKNIVSNYQSRYANNIDQVFLLIFLGMGMGTIISGYALRNSPVLAGIAILVIIIVGVLALNFANVFDDFAKDADIETYASDFPIMVNIMKYLPHVAVIFGFLFVILMFAKRGGSPGI